MYISLKVLTHRKGLSGPTEYVSQLSVVPSPSAFLNQPKPKVPKTVQFRQILFLHNWQELYLCLCQPCFHFPVLHRVLWNPPSFLLQWRRWHFIVKASIGKPPQRVGVGQNTTKTVSFAGAMKENLLHCSRGRMYIFWISPDPTELGNVIDIHKRFPVKRLCQT